MTETKAMRLLRCFMFNKGDMVLYGGEGVCRVEGIEEKKIGTATASYYVLCRVDGVNSVFFVPVESRAAQEKMCRVITAPEIKKIVAEARAEELPETDRERRELYKNAICSSDRSKIASLIKSVCALREKLDGEGKKLHKTEEYFLDDAKKFMFGELSAVFVMEKNDVIPFVLGEIDPCEKTQN